MPILLSVCGADGKLSLTGTLSIFMDTAQMHEEAIGCGIRKMEAQGLYWIIGKHRLEYLDTPGLTDEVIVRTWFQPPSKLYSMRQYEMTDLLGRVLVKGETEWLVATEGCKKILPVRDYIPAGYEFPDRPLFPEKTERISREFTEDQLQGTYTVQSGDIDYIGHMNNTAYARVILRFLSNEELQKMPLRGAELSYSRQCLEGEKLQVYRRNTQTGCEFGAFSESGENVLTARLITQKSADIEALDIV